MKRLVYKEIQDHVAKTHDIGYNREFKDLQKKRNYKKVGDFAPGPSYYKYFTLESAIKCLDNETIAFVEPSIWQDAYESLYYEADYSNVTSDDKTHPRVFCTCATNQKHDEPAWRIYSSDDNVCVQFEIDRPKFRLAILKALIDGDSVYEGTVQYTSKWTVENIGKRQKMDKKTKLLVPNKLYDEFIDNKHPFSIDNFINLLLLKRKDFAHEQETRFIIVKKDDLDNISDPSTSKAQETRNEETTATGRKVTITRGKPHVLQNINWVEIIKSITINADTSSQNYKDLYCAVESMIKRNIANVTQQNIYLKKLTPIFYPVYGKLQKMTIDK